MAQCGDAVGERQRGKVFAPIERLHHRGDGGRQRQRGQACVGECRIAYLGHTLGDGDGGEVGTILEGILLNLRNAHGDVNRRQTSIGKGTLTDGLQGRRKTDGGDALTAVERIAGDFSDTLGDDQVGNLRVLVAVEMLGIVQRGGIRTAPTDVAPPGEVIDDEFAVG